MNPAVVTLLVGTFTFSGYAWFPFRPGFPDQPVIYWGFTAPYRKIQRYMQKSGTANNGRKFATDPCGRAPFKQVGGRWVILTVLM